MSNSGSIHALLLHRDGAWQDVALPMPPNVTAASEAFGLSPAVDADTVLFLGRDIVTGDMHACAIRLPPFPFTRTWGASIL